MSDDLSSRRCLVYDCGLYTGLAWALSKHFGEVMYFRPWDNGSPTLLDAVVGDGYANINRVREFWSVLDQVDLFIFPDCGQPDLQVYLESIGKRVWGSRYGANLERKRWQTKKLITDVGLPVQPVQRVVGVDALRDLLREHRDRYVKIDTYRADMESWPHLAPRKKTLDGTILSEQRIDELAFRLGPLKHEVRFIVEDKIPTEIEVGFDGYNIDGQWPKLAMQGYEIKDACLIGELISYDKLPDEVREVNSKIEKYLKDHRYRNCFSTEIRVGEDSLPYPIDFTCRFPCPSGEIQIVLYKNLGEIMWHGSMGEMVDPIPAAKYAVEAMIYSDWAHGHWQTIELEDADVEDYITIFNATNITDSIEATVPIKHDMAVITNEIGAVVGIGDSVADAIEHLKSNAEKVHGMGIEIRIDALAKALSEINEAQQQGIPFSDANLPEPASVV